MAKRLLCVVLSLLMIMAVLPTGVVAEDGSGLPTKGTVGEGTYILTDDVTLTGSLTIPADTKVTIDLAGHTIYTYQGSITANAITVNGTLNIKDSSSGGMITSSGTTVNVSYSMITVKTGGTLNFESGTLENKSLVSAVDVAGGTLNVSGGTISNSKGSYYAVYFQSGTVVISDGTITTSGQSSYALYSKNGSNGTITINGGAISNTYNDNSSVTKGGAIRAQAYATWIINNGTITSTSGCAVYVVTSFTINGGTFSCGSGTSATSTSSVIYVQGTNSYLTVTGGTFTNTSTSSKSTVFGKSETDATTYSWSDKATITGGTFSSSSSSDSTISTVLSECCDADNGTTYEKNSDGTYTVTTTSYTLTYNANGGTGTVVGGTYTSGSTATVASGESLTREGYTFSGWNTASDGSGTTYAAGYTFTISADTTLYAVWTETLDKTWVSAYNVYNGNSLGIGFYIPSSVMTDPTQYTVEITITYGGSTGTITAGQSYTEKYTYGSSGYWSAPDSDGDYFIEFHNIMAYQMTDKISVDIYDSSSNKVCETFTTCIREYEEQYMDYCGEDSDGYTLAYAILLYGGESQQTNNYNTDDRADKNIASIAMLLSLLGE
ncbi:MAG: InlB B-repeat-containing protein [Oscillospiraceae bacterium]|nr:InlB B-repeat-containing protein [Oscillospiraceae bacterium]